MTRPAAPLVPLAPSGGQEWSQIAVSWVAVTILRPISPGISSAIWFPRFRSCSLWGWSESWDRPLSTTWPMNSSFTALLFHNCGRKRRRAEQLLHLNHYFIINICMYVCFCLCLSLIITLWCSDNWRRLLPPQWWASWASSCRRRYWSWTLA